MAYRLDCFHVGTGVCFAGKPLVFPVQLSCECSFSKSLYLEKKNATS